MSETKFSPIEASTNQEAKKADLIKRLLSPEIKKFIIGEIYKFKVKTKNIEDISQNVLFNAHRAISEERFDERDAKLTTWLYKIIRNECINFFRKDKNAEKNGLTDIEFNEGRFSGDLLTAEDYVKNREKDKKIQNLLNRLNPKHKQVMELYIQGYTQEEIGEKLGIPANTVGTRTHHAKKRLFELMAEDELNKNTPI